jgi:hypothetical protein
LHFYRINKEKNISFFVKCAEDLLFFLVFTIMKVDFEAVVISAVNKDCKGSVITGCHFYLETCGDNYKILYYGGAQRN